MNNKQLVILILGWLSSPAFAATISINGPANAGIGDSFQVEIWGDFSGEGFIAGGITFFWDDACAAYSC